MITAEQIEEVRLCIEAHMNRLIRDAQDMPNGDAVKVALVQITNALEGVNNSMKTARDEKLKDK